jgi:hypothetical protein
MEVFEFLNIFIRNFLAKQIYVQWNLAEQHNKRSLCSILSLFW